MTNMYNSQFDTNIAWAMKMDGGMDHGGMHGSGGDEHGGHGHAGHHHAGCTNMAGEYSMGLHVGAIFILLVASVLGTIMPLAGKYVPCLKMSPLVFVLGKCAATGVVVTVALLTMLNHSIHSFSETCVVKALNSETYDAFALLFAMISAMLMHLLDVVLEGVLQSWSSCDCGAYTSTNIGETDNENKCCSTVGPCGIEGCGDQPGRNCEASGCCQNRGALASASLTNGKRVASAVLMEFGLALHSVFLGLSVGIAKDSQMTTLLIALSFHQLLEGVALGSRLVEASMSLALEVVMVLIFSLSVPIGIAIGVITVLGSKTPITGPAFVTLQGVVNAVGAGMLLYIGFSLILIDFSADMKKVAGPTAPHHWLRRVGMFAAFWGGTALMTVLAKFH